MENLPGNRPWYHSGWLAALGIIATAANLRPTAVAVGPVLKQLQADLGMGDALAGLLTSLPAFAFAVFGATATGLARRFGVHRVSLAALILVGVGSFTRAFTHTPATFLVCSVVALSGMAVGNVLLPTLVKRHFSHKLAFMTGVYTTVMQLALTLASLTTAPLSQYVGSWRPVFAYGALLALVSALPWLALSRSDRDHAHSEHAIAHRYTMGDLARTRLGWIMAIYFGLQSAQAYTIFGWLAAIYVDAGLSPTKAGLMLGLCMAAGIPLAFLLPAYTSRNPTPYLANVVFFVFAIAGYLGLMLAPTSAPALWAVCITIGTAAFPLILTLLGIRAATSAGTAVLSAFTQSVGYLIAAAGPLLVGVLREVTGGFTWPLIVLLAVNVPLLIFGLLAARPRVIEDELPA